MLLFLHTVYRLSNHARNGLLGSYNNTLLSLSLSASAFQSRSRAGSGLFDPDCRCALFLVGYIRMRDLCAVLTIIYGSRRVI